MPGPNYQKEVGEWMDATFPQNVVENPVERALRLLEEALEVSQSAGLPQEAALKLVNYVYGREPGHMPKEIGGVMVAAAALCNALSIDMEASAESELARCWTIIDKVRAKWAQKNAQGVTVDTPATPDPGESGPSPG